MSDRLGGPYPIGEYVKRTYAEKLRDPRWQKARLGRLEQAQWRCERCGDASSELQIHHNWYIKNLEPWDYSPDQLTVLCADCHDYAGTVHARLREILSTASVGKQESIASTIAAGGKCELTNYENCESRRIRLADCFWRIFNESAATACKVCRLHDHKGNLEAYPCCYLTGREEEIVALAWEQCGECRGNVEFLYESPYFIDED
jgi:hypothetical protein